MGAGLYPPPINVSAPRGLVAYQGLASTSTVTVETRCYLITWTAEAGRSYRIVAQLGCVDNEGITQSTTFTSATNSAIIRARWAVGTDATTTSTDLGYMLATVFDTDSQMSSGTTAVWHLLNAPAGPVAVAVTLAPYKTPATTYGSVRLLTTGGTSNTLSVEDVGSWPLP
ncbi:hypothetical protein [Streptomyces phage phiScoe3]|nr:hypothetical protein [Streptomyces phage phiScoe3]